MKGLTVRQPWASLIVHGVKRVETRTRPTKIRGRIGIIAGLHRPCDLETWGDWQYAASVDRPLVSSPALQHHASGMPGAPDDLPVEFGVLIGTVELYDCVAIIEARPLKEFSAGIKRGETLTVAQRTGNRLAIVDYWTNAGQTRDAITDQLPYGDFTPGRWAWLLRDPQPLAEPIPMRGALGWQEIELP